MQFDLDNLNPPARFYFDDKRPEDGSVLLRICSGNDLDDIYRKTSKKQPPEYKRGARYEVPDLIDEVKRMKMMWDFIIMDWDKVTDGNGKPLECNMDNKYRLMRESVKFASFIGASIEKLSVDVAAYQEEAEKNSESSQSE